MNAWKATLLLAGALLLASPALAQCADPSGNTCNPGSFYDPSNNFYGPYNNLYPPSIAVYYLPVNESSQELATFAVNDGEYVPSEMMDYEDAVALGARQLQQVHASGDPASLFSLADAARSALGAGAAGGNSVAFVQQDQAGNLQVCGARGDNCQPVR
ncbi:MAG TPA: hypothetical protein VKG84_01105 [Candidatus Acidoferrales bacterium]|nr:hypothetical protein [Candidatus Acidoferrales bacterium]